MSRPPVELNVDRVPSVTCARCGQAVEIASVKPLAKTTCGGCGAAVRVPGKIGQFLLTRLLGRGAMGAVFEGVDEELGRRVAIKVLTPRKGVEEDARLQELLTEARALARINHPNVVQIHSVGQHRDQPYIVMELVSGGEKLMRYADGEERLDEKRALELMAAVAEGLDVASKANLVHGDIKPQNILVNADGVPKVVDFGLSQKAKVAGGRTVWGTPYYISPERARGGACDVRGDIFSLGATFWHLLCGRPPYEGESVRDVVSARLRQPPPDLREHRTDIHAETSALLLRMMAGNPLERPASYGAVAVEARAAAEVAAAPTPDDPLDALARSTSSLRTYPPAPPTREPKAKRSRRVSRVVWVGVGALALVCVIGAALVVALRDGKRDGPSEGGDGSNAAPAPLSDSNDVGFDGAVLPVGWSGTAPNGKGQVELKAAAMDSATSQVARAIGRGDMAVTLDFAPLAWDLNLQQALIVRFVEPEAELTLRLEKDKAQNPVLRIGANASGSDLPARARNLPYDPRSVTIWVGWTESKKQWSVALGVDAARPKLIETVTVPGGSTSQRRLVVSVEATGSNGAFTAGFDRFRLDTGEPDIPPR